MQNQPTNQDTHLQKTYIHQAWLTFGEPFKLEKIILLMTIKIELYQEKPYQYQQRMVTAVTTNMASQQTKLVAINKQ